ncbi:hypothetical protein QM565_18110 [Geitlerinema splendidum]|nr:hypothetical protein [Geitlerinema splendidum]
MIADDLILKLPKVSLSSKDLLPESSGLYYVLDSSNMVWYIGQAKNLYKRWQGKAHHRFYQLEVQKKRAYTIYYELVPISQLDVLEKDRIAQYHPHLNSSPVKTKKVRPTETLLRETLSAIADFAFIVGVELPSPNHEPLTSCTLPPKKNIVGLIGIHICIDTTTFQEIFQPTSVEEQAALCKAPFVSRKTYANKWDTIHFLENRLCVNGYVVTVNFWERLYRQTKLDDLREYTLTTLATSPIRALTPASLLNVQNSLDSETSLRFDLKRLVPYESDLIQLHFNEPVDCELYKANLQQISADYKAGRRGCGSRSSQSQPISSDSEVKSIEELLIKQEIDINKYAQSGISHGWSHGERIKLYIRPFGFDFSQNQLMYGLVYGRLEDRWVRGASSNFEKVYLLSSVDTKAWLLVEEYLQDFAKPALPLSNREGFVEKLYISPRKFIVPARVNIRLESLNYSAWIPIGFSPSYPTFEEVKAEICRRFNRSSLPELKLGFKKETIGK